MREAPTATYRAKIAQGGCVVIPAEIRSQPGLQMGTEVVLDVTDGELRVRSLRRAIEQACALVRRQVPADVRLTDELIAERREASRLE